MADQTAPATGMEVPRASRFRTIKLLLLAVAGWSVVTGNPHPRTLLFWVSMGCAVIWALSLYSGGGGIRRGRAAMVGFVAAVAATLAYPALATLLMISVGWTGAHIPWRALRIWGSGTVLFASWTLMAAGGRLDWRLVLSPDLLNVVILFTVLLLLGRLAADNDAIRDAQARSLAELRVAHAELQTRAAIAEELATLQERTRLSRELHDTLGHALSAVTIQMEAVRRLLPTDSGKADALLRETQETARAAMRDLRHYLSDLREPNAPLDLAGMLRRMCEEAAIRNGWTATVDVSSVDLSPAGRAALVRVAKEALQNCERHASPHRVCVELRSDTTQVVLRIQDDGCGFDPERVAGNRFGLQGMRERLVELGGALCIESQIGSGTSVIGTLPRMERAKEGEAHA